MIPIIGLDKAEVLAALYNYAQPQGMGFMHFTPAPMTQEEAQKEINWRQKEIYDGHSDQLYFDYLHGRVMKVDIASDELDERLYDRDNGQGAAEKVITALREGRETPVLERERVISMLEQAIAV